MRLNISIPDKWAIYNLDEVAKVQTGIAKNQNVKGDVITLPYLRVANVQDGYLDLSEIKLIKILKEKFERYSLEKGDVLLTEGGDFDKLGRGAVWMDEISPCVHQNHVFAVRVNEEKLSPYFLSLLTSSPLGKKYFQLSSTQSTNLACISVSQLKKFPTIVPPIDEQKAIADVLSTWDQAIDKTEQLIKAKEMQFEWIIQDQLNVNHDIKILSDLTDIRKGKQLSKADMEEKGDYYVLNGGVNPSGKTTHWNTGEHTISISEGGNSCGFVNYNTEKFWSGGHCYTLEKLSDSVVSKYLYYYLKAHQRMIMRLRVGSGLPNIQKKDLAKFKVNLPSKEVQQKIANALTDVENEVSILKKLLSQYQTQKRGLMQRLLTGEWRVKLTK